MCRAAKSHPAPFSSYYLPRDTVRVLSETKGILNSKNQNQNQLKAVHFQGWQTSLEMALVKLLSLLFSLVERTDNFPATPIPFVHCHE